VIIKTGMAWCMVWWYRTVPLNHVTKEINARYNDHPLWVLAIDSLLLLKFIQDITYLMLDSIKIAKTEIHSSTYLQHRPKILSGFSSIWSVKSGAMIWLSFIKAVWKRKISRILPEFQSGLQDWWETREFLACGLNKLK